MELNFEGREFRFSPNPTVLDDVEAESLAADSVGLTNILERFASWFSDHDPASRDQDDLIAKYFEPLAPWFVHISREQRLLPHINLLRFDTVRNADSRHKILENNTACPGGVVHCGLLREAWRQAASGALGLTLEREDNLLNPPHFLKSIDRLMARVDRPGVLAILNDRGSHKNEVDTLVAQWSQGLVGRTTHLRGVISADIREIDPGASDEPVTIHGEEVGLAYCKLPPFELDPNDQDLKPWLEVLADGKVEMLNSLTAMFITESKASIAALQDPEVQEALKMTQGEIRLLSRYPITELVTAGELPTKISAPLVAKPASLTRGEGVTFLESETDVAEFTRSERRDAWVWQERIDLPSRPHWLPGSTHFEYFGVDSFVLGGTFGGFVGRSHTDRVFNVGNGGDENVVILRREIAHNGLRG